MLKKTFYFLLVVVLLSACSKNEVETSEQGFTSTDVRTNAELDAIGDDISLIVQDQYQSAQNTSGRNNWATWLPACASINTTFTETNWTSTVSFGDDCQLANGNTVEGSVIITGSTDFSAEPYIVTYELEDFHHNDRHVEGSRQVSFSTESTSAQIQPHTVANILIDYTVTYPTGSVFTRTGNRLRECTEGFNTPGWNDDVYLFTGSWTTNFSNGSFVSTITDPLRFEVGCGNFVSGTLQVSKSSDIATLDYGNGQCDSTAVLTINNGNPISINW